MAPHSLVYKRCDLPKHNLRTGSFHRHHRICSVHFMANKLSDALQQTAYEPLGQLMGIANENPTSVSTYLHFVMAIRETHE